MRATRTQLTAFLSPRLPLSHGPGAGSGPSGPTLRGFMWTPQVPKNLAVTLPVPCTLRLSSVVGSRPFPTLAEPQVSECSVYMRV